MNPTYIRLALFPADISFSDGSHPLTSPNLKVFVSDSYLEVYGDSPDGPTPLIQEELVDFSGNPRIGYIAQTPSHTYYIKRSRGCGCGSRLRGYNPYRGVPYRGAEYV